MNLAKPKKAPLLNSIPADRVRFLSAQKTDLPRAGDIVQLDQGYTGPDGRSMVLAYFVDESRKIECELEVYESELGPDEKESWLSMMANIKNNREINNLRSRSPNKVVLFAFGWDNHSVALHGCPKLRRYVWQTSAIKVNYEYEN